MKPNRFERQADLVTHERLRDLTVSVIGVGAIGRQVALQLAAIGTSSMQLFDFDRVESTNVTTQGYPSHDIGCLKVDATREAILQLDPTIQVETTADRYRPQYSLGPVIFCCVDSIQSRSVIWRSVRSSVQLWLDARMLGEVMRVLTATSDDETSFYETTLFDATQAQQGACTARSTIYTASIAAGLLTHQFTRWLRGLPLDRDLSCNLLASELVVR